MISIAVLVFATVVDAHSWVECVSYDPPSFDHLTLGGYDRARCSGYPRGFQKQFEAGFGIETGYNWEYPDCARDTPKSTDYTQDIPMAKYQPGQIIYISHPAKNHVADTCTNPFIPSESLEVKMSSKTGVDTFDVSLKMVGEDHSKGVIDHLGYQRCFEFCANPDKSHCLTGWTLPTNIEEGVYSFSWSWQFNPQQWYQNCFDAYVGGTPNSTQMPEYNNSGSGSGDDITITPNSGVPTPSTTTPVPTPSTTTPIDTTIVEPPLTTSSSLPSPSDISTPANMSEVISSGASSLNNPVQTIVSYITGYFNISGMLNISVV